MDIHVIIIVDTMILVDFRSVYLASFNSFLKSFHMNLCTFSIDAIALYVESLATQSYETQSVPSNVVAAGQQLPYQPMTQPGAAVPGASPQAAVPAPQPQMQSSQKVSTLENSNAKVEG